MRRANLKTAALLTGGLGAILLTTGAADTRSNPDYGFVVSNFNMAFYRGDERIDCPQGRSLTFRESYLASLPAAERARLLKTENAEELNRLASASVIRTRGRDICSSVEAFADEDHHLEKLSASKVAPGMDLDGVGDGQATATTCAHKNFTGLKGEKGVDNEFFRVVHCNTMYRGAVGPAGSPGGDGASQLRWENNTVVVAVRDVQSWANDPSVELVLASSPDKPTVVGGGSSVARGEVLDGGSFVMTSNPRYRVAAKGRIENGVLTTDPVDMVMPYNWVGASGGEFILKRARFRLKLTAEGQLAGEAGGYRPIDNTLGSARVAGPGYAASAGVDCISLYKTLKLMADGDPDPKTGKCTTISQALVFSATPAFVFDDGRLVAAPRGAVRSASN